MKKIYYLVVAGLLCVSTTSAQSIVDGGFESSFYPGSALGINSPNVGAYSVSGSVDWLVIGANETTNPITATQSAAAISVNDATVNSAIFSGSYAGDNVPGIVEQAYYGPFDPNASATTMNFTFNYTYAPTGTDTAMVRVMAIDTNVATNSGVLWVGVKLISTAASTTTSGSITTWTDVQSGTPNELLIDITPSTGSFLNGTAPNVGSKIVVDDVSLSISSSSASVVNQKNPLSIVYPNPVANTLNVKINNANATSISIYGVDGNLMKTASLNGTFGSVDVSNLNSGMYFYTIATKDGQLLKSKFIKR